MSDPLQRPVRVVATLGLAVSGPLTLLSGIFAFVTIPSGVNSTLVTIFVIGVGLTTMFALLYVNDHIRHTR